MVAARFGKSGGSLIQQGLLVVCGSIGAMTPYLAIALFVIIAIWLVSATKLNKLFLIQSALKEKSSQEKKLLFLQKLKDPHQFREHLLLRTLLHKIQ